MHFSRTDKAGQDGFTHIYSGISSDDLEDKVHDAFSSRGYKLKSGEEGRGTYTKGNRVARILLGAFYKYFKCDVNTEKHGTEELSVQVRKGTSGMSGGLIGMNQVKKELVNISEMLARI